MAEEVNISKVIVKNLPDNDDWTPDYLTDFLETVTPLQLTEHGAIQTFEDIRHTSLVSLAEPVSDSAIQEAQNALSATAFASCFLLLHPLHPSTTCCVLVRYDDPSIKDEILGLYFENSRRSGCGDVELLNCSVIEELGLAIVKYKSPEGVSGVLAKGDHTLGKNRARLRVEEWHEQFHRPLLEEFVARKTTPLKPKLELSHKPQQSAEKSEDIISKSWQIRGNSYQFWQGEDSSSKSQHGEDSSSKSQQGEDSSSKSHVGQDSSLNLHQGQDSSSKSPQGQDSSLNSQQGQDSSSKSQQDLDSSLKSQQGQDSSSKSQQDQDSSSKSLQGKAKMSWMHGLLQKGFSLGKTKPQARPPLPPKPQLAQTLTNQPLMSDLSPKPLPLPSAHPDTASSSQATSDVAASFAPDTEMETILRKMQQLELENRTLKNKGKTETEKSGNTPKLIQKPTNEKLYVASHQLKLLKDFKAECGVTVLDSEILFYGSEDDCQEAKREFLLRLQNLAEDTWCAPDSVVMMLETANGKRYMEDMLQRFPRCSVTLQGTDVQFAALDQADLQAFKTEFEGIFTTQICQVPPSLTSSPSFKDLQSKLQSEHVVMLTLPRKQDSEDVQLTGVRNDVALAARQVEEYTKKNRSNDTTFHVTGKVQGLACKKWFSRELDEVKQVIVKNGELKDENSSDEGYSLQFQCRQEFHTEVLEKLKRIKDSIHAEQIDLNQKFTNYSDRALLVNGLYSTKVGNFCDQLKNKLHENGVDCISDIILPEQYTLPQMRHKDTKGRASRDRRDTHRGQSLDKQSGRRGEGWHGGHRRTSQRSAVPAAPLPSTVQMGGTSITVKQGDITSEQVACAVNIVGKDLVMKGTTIGSEFLKRCPQLAQLLEAGGQAAGDSRRCRVLMTQGGGNLPMSILFHAVLYKLPHNIVAKVVKDLVTQILQLAVQRGLKTIAFPPLGVGKRFRYGRRTTAAAMCEAIQQYLQTAPTSFQNISIVVYDSDIAGIFAGVLQKQFEQSKAATAIFQTANYAIPLFKPVPFIAPQPQATVDDLRLSEDEAEEQPRSASSDVESGSDSEPFYQQEVEEVVGSPRGRFLVVVCTRISDDYTEAADFLLRELKTTFLWTETLQGRQFETFRRLDSDVLEDLFQNATRSNVLLSVVDKGIRVCGQKDRVNELLGNINKKMIQVLHHGSEGQSKKRAQFGLPSDTARLPSYWNICAKDKAMSMDKAIEGWHKRATKEPNSVTKEVLEAIRLLVQNTWDAAKAGHGADARNLKHTNIQVTNVQRLENPEMWKQYSQKRENLFDKLVFTGSSFTAVEKLSGSRGPIETTAKIGDNSPLSREIYHKINEHYLFHGTKSDVLSKIYTQGLDFRMAGEKVMLGRGLYTCESSTKADQYTDPKHVRTSGQDLSMILARVLLGEPFIHKEQQPKPFNRPPCRRCSLIQCGCNSSLFDSIIDVARLFREFVVYEQNVAYPEYFITYRRI